MKATSTLEVYGLPDGNILITRSDLGGWSTSLDQEGK